MWPEGEAKYCIMPVNCTIDVGRFNLSFLILMFFFFFVCFKIKALKTKKGEWKKKHFVKIHECTFLQIRFVFQNNFK